MKNIFLLLMLSILILASCNSQTSSNSVKFNHAKHTALSIKETPPDDFIPHELTIVSAGDSLTKGVGDSTNRGGYIPYLEEKLELEKSISTTSFYNFGVKGNRSDQLLKRIESADIQKAMLEADLVIVTIGGNDLMKVVRENLSNLNLAAFNKQEQLYKENLYKVILKLRKQNPNVGIVLVGLYNPFTKWFADINEINQIIEDWNQSSKEILRKFSNTYYVEIEDLFQNNPEELLYTDYFHPNDKGYELIADRMYKTLKSEALSELATR